jgi:hypothetical protein
MANLSEFYNEELSIEHFDGCPAFIEMTVTGFTSRIYNSKLKSYKIAVCYFHERQGDWLTYVSDQRSIGQNVVKLGYYYIDQLRKRWLVNFGGLIERYYVMFDRDLSKLSNKELLEYAKDNDDYYKNKVCMPGFIDGFMFYADKRLHKLLTDFCEKKKIENPQHIFAMLSSQLEPSFINEEEAELLKLMGAGVTEARISQHLKKYSWIKSSYIGYTEYTKSDVLKEIERLKSHKPDFGLFKRNAKAKIALFAKHRFTPEIVAIANLTTMLVKWQDQRKM